MGAVTRARLEDVLGQYIDLACSSRMQWGKDDCALWCADILRSALDYDPAIAFRGRYQTRRGARRVLGKAGLAGALRSVARRHRWKIIDAKNAQVGDIGFDGFNGCLICRAPGRFVGRSPEGITVIPANAIRLCWNVAPNSKAEIRSSGHRVSFNRPATRPEFIETSAAAHEPVSTVIGLTALIEATLGATVLGVSAGTLGGAIVGIGISVGLNYAASALQQRGNQPLSGARPSPNDPSVRYNTRQPIPPKRIIYGTAQVGGALFFEETANPFLYQGLMLCAKPISAIKKIWIGTNELTFPTLSENAVLTPLAIDGQPNYATHLQASIRLGAIDQSIDPLLARDFPTLTGTPIAAASGTILSDMSNNTNAFDDVTDAKTTSSASLLSAANITCYLGKDWGTPTTVIGFQVYAPNNSTHGFSNTNNSTYEFTLQGATVSDFSDAVDLVNVPAQEYGPSAVVSSSDPAIATAYQYHRVLLEEAHAGGTSHNVWITEAKFFTAAASVSEFRQRGIATAVLRYSFGADQSEYTALWGQSQRPNPIFLVDGISVPDPRNPAHILEFDPTDADAVAAAEASWSFSNNASLCQAHYLIQQYGGRIDPRRIDWDKVARAADWDDGLIGMSDGQFIKRGTIDGLITLNQRPSDVISPMLSANRGFVLESAGKVWVSSSEPRTPVATIHDAILSGGVEYRAAKPKRDLINRLKVRFVAEDREYQTVDGPVLSRTDLQTADQELLDGVLELPFTLDNRRAQVLQKAFLQTARLGRRLSCVVDIELLALAEDELVGNAVTVSSNLFPQFNGSYFVETWGFTDQFGAIQLSLSEYDPSIETDWDYSADQQPFTQDDLDL